MNTEKDMKKAEWIWVDSQQPDVHSEFVCTFAASSLDGHLNISCDGNYVVFLNGELIGLDQLSDYPDYKILDTYDLQGKMVAGENTLRILVWHIGVGSVNYRAETPGIYFEIYDGDKLVAASNIDTQSRVMNRYTPGYQKWIAQVGLTFQYDFCRNDAAFVPSIVTKKAVSFADSNVSNLKLLASPEGRVLVREPKRVLVDLGKEHFGLIGFALNSKTAHNPFTIYFGEHILPNGELLRDISSYHFGADFIANKGRNALLDYLRPVGCRYLELASEREVEVEELFLRPIEYPFREQRLLLADPLDQRIYDTCVHTLKCCASKHYMDCPWREQGMYILDSRNQMLCGYHAFSEYELPRFNLLMLAKGMTPYGILSPCPPSAQDHYIIPFFSLIYVIQVFEYVTYSGDESILAEVEDVLKTIMQTFLDRMDQNGLIPRFSWEHFWNFYEWTEGSNGWPCDEEASQLRGDDTTYDLILNAAFVMAMDKYILLLNRRGQPYSFPLEEYRQRIRKVFFVEGTGLFRLDSGSEKYSKLGCSFALLAKLSSGIEALRIAEKMISCDEITDCSLACEGYYYDALLSVSREYRDYILQDIRKKYKYMLDQGATTFWETIHGSSENGGIGSLCHAWSAIPIYYYHKFLSNDNVANAVDRCLNSRI